jgi:hypothetical protein
VSCFPNPIAGKDEMTIRWTTDLNTGIDVIDKQHMRIVDYINDLEKAHQAAGQEIWWNAC